MHNGRMHSRTIALTLTSFILGTISIGIVYAWSGPTAAPPGGNVAAPINVGSTDQVKDGGIGVNKLAVFGNSLLGGFTGSNAYLNFGEIPTPSDPSTGYGIRDNAGILEFKNDGGDWASLQQTLYDLCGGDCSGGGGGGTPVAFLLNKGETNQSVSASAWTKLTWSTEAFDTNDNFANNRFTPTVAGKYLFTLTAYCEGSGDNDDCWVAIYKNGVVVSESGTGVHDIGGSSGPNVSIVLDMNGTTDYVEAYAWNRTGSSIHGETYTTNFSGALLSPQAGGGGSSYWTASGNDILNTNSGPVRTAGEFVSGQHVSMGYISSGGSSPVCYQSGVYWGSALGLTSCSSDARLKTNIVPLPDHTLDKIMHVRPVTFTWKKDASSIEHAGFIAQDTLPYAPETVGVNRDDGYYTWDSNAMLSYTVKALQELNTKVDDNAARARKEICLDTSVGTQVCITGDQLHALLQDSHQ